MKMNAIIKPSDAPGLQLTQVDIPTPGPNDVLIKVTKTSICGTDLHIDKWDKWASQTTKVGVTIGHEFIGTVHEIGSNVSRFNIGDRVSGEGHIVCNNCRNCLRGDKHACPKTINLGRDTNGCFAEFLILPEDNTWLAAPDISDNIMACFDPYGNAIHTCLSFPLVGEDVLITGAGPIGCMAAAIAKHAGARHIVVTDINQYRLDLAKKMGATLAINPNETSLQDAMKQLGMKEGFDVGLEMSGAPSAFHSMIDAMIHNGNIALLGVIPDGTPVDWTKIIFKCLDIKGIFGRKMYETWYQSTALIQAGLDINPVITHTFNFKDYREAFDLLHNAQAGKVILDWTK